MFHSHSLLCVFLIVYTLLTTRFHHSYGQTLSIVSSVASTNARLSPGPPIPFVLINISDPTSQYSALELFPDISYQSIHAFGGAITEAAASTWLKLPSDLQHELLQAYYNRTSGHGYNWARIPLNSCDFTEASYSFDDVPDDFDLKYFDINATHDRNNIIPFILAARNIASAHTNNGDDGLLLFASPWSPPAWMKTNGQMDRSLSPGLKTDFRYHTAWANFFVKWLQTYESFGIKFWGLTPQNEPEALPAPWESCLYTPEQEVDFVVKYLAPAVKKFYPDINIMFYDHNKMHVLDWAHAFYTNPVAKNLVWGIALHWYSGDQFDNVRQIYEAWPDKPIMPTEASLCGSPALGRWSDGEAYSHDIIGDLNAFAVGWTDWNVLLDQTGGPNHAGNRCNAPILARLDQTPVRLYYQPMYYHLGHFTRYLPRGSIRIMHQFDIDNTNLEFVTFLVPLSGEKDTGKSWTRLRAMEYGTSNNQLQDQIVIVVLNRQDSDQSFKVQAAGSTFASVSVPAHSIHTLMFDASLLKDTKKKSKQTLSF